MPLLKDWRQLLGCRLCWKIAACVFLLFLTIESLILVPSAQRFETAMLAQRINAAIITIEPTLAAAGYGSRLEMLVEGVRNAVGKYGITGVLMIGPTGAPITSSGDIAGLEGQIARAAPMAARPQRHADGSRLDLSWPSERGIVVATRIDTSGVAGEVMAYTLRIAGLVAIIGLVVTIGTMLVLNWLVLRPVLRLRASARAAAADPDRADTHVLQCPRSDEIGELIVAHDSLLVQVAASKLRDRELAEQRARHVSSHDVLTGLPNRVALLQHLDRLRHAHHHPAAAVSLYLINLVQFRLLNASIGAVRCDELLRQFAARLAQVARPGDFVVHFGADHFAIARANGQFHSAAAAEFAEQLLAGVSHGYGLGSVAPVSLAARIGISSATIQQLDGNVLVNEAELALARTREDESASYEFYAPSFGDEVRTRHALRRDIERGIAAGEFFCLLQPKLALDSISDFRLAGAEMLIRWRHPLRGIVGPAEFIPLAEATGLIVPLGDAVLNEACALLRTWLDHHGWAPRLAINLSARQFMLPDLDRRLEAALTAAGISPDLLEVEITETAAMKNVQQSARTLEKLRQLGISVSIDDFGTGYSSLAYLRQFAVDAIKIDKSFVDDIGVDGNAEAICEAILRLGQALGCRVIAEGVESEAQVAFLHRRECDEVQGYYFSQPVSATEFESRWLMARTLVEA